MSAKAQDDDFIMNLIELALARPCEEREDYLRGACAGDTELLAKVRSYVQWEERMNGFLLDPLFPPALDGRPFEPGQLLDNRFGIIREVAEGGMGVVYEAMDEKLERRIAIKCAKAGFRKRLPPEVRNASEISHPNVCKIFEIHTTSTDRGEVEFLTMEFLEGETLAERLRRGPLANPEARLIAQQLCAGLAEAHRKRVIHGDLKSNNVILTQGADGAIRAVITDFGLARGPEVAQRTSQSGELAGTPDYMAPELWKGAKASVASDLYALGVILYELASGRRPYGPHAGWEERLNRKPPAVHRKWDPILQRCLDPDPTRRFASADKVEKALGPSHTRRWMLTIAAGLVVAISSGLVTYERATVPKEAVRLAVLPFESDQYTANLRDGLLRDTNSQLAHLRGNARTKFTAIPAAESARRHADSIEKARTLLGATHVLHATLNQQKDKIVLHAYLTDARSGVNAQNWTAAYAPGQLRYAPVALAGMVTGTLRLPPIAMAAVVNAVARQDYLSGISALRKDSGVDAGLVLLERAVAADPESPLTHAGLAEAEWFKYFLTQDGTWLVRATESARQAELREPDLAPVVHIQGILDANAGRYERSEAEYRRVIELEPGNSDAHRRLGLVLEQNNQPDQALVEYRKALEVSPGYYRAYQDMGSFYFNRGNYDEAAKFLNKMVELAPNEPNAHYALGVTYLDLGRFAESEKELRISIGLGDTPAALHTLGLVLMYEGRDHEAVPYISQALSRAPERYLWWSNLGIAYHRLKLKPESERASRRALALAEKEMTRNPRDGQIRSYLAYLCARLGDRSRAESEIAQALALSPNDADTRWAAAVTYEALGERDSTLSVLSASPAGVLADLSHWPDVADLHTDPRFQQLLASHQLK
jgi:serine/threonine protein kinase/Flp pilus assembly protein TadD